MRSFVQWAFGKKTACHQRRDDVKVVTTRKVEVPTHRGTMVDGTTGAAMTITTHTEARVKERDNGTVGHAQLTRKEAAK